MLQTGAPHLKAQALILWRHEVALRPAPCVLYPGIIETFGLVSACSYNTIHLLYDYSTRSSLFFSVRHISTYTPYFSLFIHPNRSLHGTLDLVFSTVTTHHPLTDSAWSGC